MALHELAALLLSAALYAQPVGSPEGCLPGEAPALHSGFADFGEMLGSETVGVPVDCEHPNPQGASGDTLQTTSGGVFTYYRFNNLVVFTSAEMHHWATAHDGIVTWTGYQPYPPEVGAKLYGWDSLTPGQAP